MAERNNPIVETFDVGNAYVTVYRSPLAPDSVPVSVFNAGDVTVWVRYGTQDPIPLAAGFGAKANPDPDISVRTALGTGRVTVATGVETFSAGVSSTGDLAQADVAAIAAAHTQKSLLTNILLQLRKLNVQASRITDEEIRAMDFPDWRDPPL